MKQIFYSSKEMLIGCRMDWLIYNLVGDVLTHYWYRVQCKNLDYVKNKEQANIIVCAFL
jgi:hypothetical protein